MKKIISLIILPGLLAIFFIFIIINAPVSEASSGSPSTAGDKTIPEQAEPPWYNQAWHYRRPVIIANSGASLPYYQILIKLDIYNFDFSQTKPDGSDVRFTHSDGTTELKYWIESWDSPNRLAYVWVRVPSVSNGNTTIYLYYNNPGANSVSDGANTFDNFDDDWGQFPGKMLNNGEESWIVHSSNEVNNLFVWTTIGGTPTASAGILSLNDGAGIKSTTTYLYNAVGFKAKYSLGSIDAWIGFINGVSGQRTMITDIKPGNIDDLYLIDSVNGLNFEYLVLPKWGGENWHAYYHIYEIRWKLGQSMDDIDHGTSTVSSTIPGYVPNSFLPVTLYNDTVPNGILQVDWVYVRQYRDPEPTFSVKAEQGLVALSIGNTDYPDPVRKNAKLTYQLTIANTSSINAPGVVVTDTLPGNILIGPISTSQGSCVSGSVVLCDLDTILANSAASITIVVTPTVDGEITNTATVGSQGYEMDYSDNTSVQVSLVDSQPPEVNWVKPVSNGNTYFSIGGTVSLETIATDNDQVNRVEFWWYDGAIYWHIYTDTTPPYQASFDTSVLDPGIPYWFEARAYDRAGNSNFPYNRSNIYIIHNNKKNFFLPLVRR